MPITSAPTAITLGIWPGPVSASTGKGVPAASSEAPHTAQADAGGAFVLRAGARWPHREHASGAVNEVAITCRLFLRQLSLPMPLRRAALHRLLVAVL